MADRAKDGGKRRKRVVFGDVMQTRVPGHIREEVRRILEEKARENDYLSESDYLRELIVKDLKGRGRL